MRVADDAVRPVEHLAGEREVLRAVLPDRRQQVVDHAVGEQPADDAGVALHRVEVRLGVASPERQSRHEVVEDEVVQDDEAPAALERIDDPAVGVRVVADVVERPRRCRAAAFRLPAATTATSIRCSSAGSSSAL